MSSPDDLVALSMDLIAETTTSNLLDDTTDGRKLKRGYDSTLRIMLASYTWRFAKRLIQIATTAGTPTSTLWTYQYQLPSDSVSPRRLQEDDRVSWVRVGDKIWTNAAPPITLEDTFLVTDPSLWPGSFEEAFIKKLGSVYAGTFKLDAALSRQLREEYYAVDFPEAKTQDAKEASIRAVRVPTLTTDIRVY